MDIIIENIGKIKEAKMNLGKLTLIAGANDSGKSTLLRSIYAGISALSDEFTTNDFLDEFKGSMLKVGAKNGKIELKDKIIINIDKINTIFNKECLEDIPNVYYIDDPSIIDYEYDFICKQRSVVYHKKDLYGDIYNSVDILKMDELDELGKLVVKGNSIYVEKEELYPNVNISSGAKLFLIIKKLITSELIKSGDFLIFDEPEKHLHPNWQLKFTELIANIIIKNKINVILSTHSPYMLNAVEVYATKCNIEPKFYMTEELGGEITLIDETLKLDEIYRTLSHAFDTLEEVMYRE